MRLREVKFLAQVQTDNKWQNWDMKLDNLDLDPVLFTIIQP